MIPAKLNVFIIHPSRVLTDHAAHGDGLLSYRYICELAARGHRISVACEELDLIHPVPNNVTLYPIEVKSKIDGFKRVEYAWKMRRLFTRLHEVQPFDIAHQLNPVFRGLSLGLIFTHVPIVLGPYVDCWGAYRPAGLKALLLGSLSRLQQEAAAAVIISGNAARTRILAKQRLAQSTFVIPYGIDLDAFAQQPFPDGDPVIVFLSGLEQRKGIFVLLEAFDTLAVRLPNVRLVIAGDGEMRSDVRASVARSVHADRITCMGKVPRPAVPGILARATLLCSPSFGEPYGMNIVEAMAIGRAVVATNAGGPVDLVRPGGGFLVPPGDACALSVALESVIAMPGLAQAMGSFNRSVVVAHSWPAVIDQLEAMYMRTISSVPANTSFRKQLRSVNS